MFSNSPVLAGAIAGEQRLRRDPSPDGNDGEMSLLNRFYRTFWDWQHLLHHATAMPGQPVVGVVDVPHILGTPQSLGHSTGTRPSEEGGKKITIFI